MISVIMLTYNREQLVGRAIESILNQTYRDFEFIIVDNGSTDNSGTIAEHYAKQDERIRVVHIPKSNIGTGRNVGLDMAQGEYITFIDDDDWCESDFLEFLYETIVLNHADISICASYKEDMQEKSFVGKPNETLLMNAEEAIITLMWRKYYNTGFPTKFFKADLFKDIRFSEKEKYEDISLMYKVLAKAEKIVYCGIAKYHVYRHEGNNSAITTKDSLLSPEYLKDYRKFYRERTKWLCEQFPENTLYWWYFDWSFQLSMVRKIMVNNIQGCDKHLEEMKQELKWSKEKLLNSPYIQEFEKKWIEDELV